VLFLLARGQEARLPEELSLAWKIMMEEDAPKY
jgi:hypothetical protein